MGFLVFLLLLAVIAVVGLLIRARLRHDQVERVRDRARLRVIEGQLAMLRAALRIGAAEHLARRRFMAMRASDPFEHRTDHEEWRPS
jgi:hypothetical protein